MSEHHKRARNVPSGQDAARHRGDLKHGKSPAINASIEARIPTADEARKKLEAIPLPPSEVLEPAAVQQQYPVVTIATDQIEPHLCTSAKAVRLYEAMFRAGEKVPPICIERSGAGFRFPFQIYNGAHRLQAAHFAGRTTIDAVIIEAPHLPQLNLPDIFMGLLDAAEMPHRIRIK